MLFQARSGSGGGSVGAVAAADAADAAAAAAVAAAAAALAPTSPSSANSSRRTWPMIHIAIVGGNGPGGAAEGRIPNLLKTDSGARLASDRAYRRFGRKLRRGVRFSRRI